MSAVAHRSTTRRRLRGAIVLATLATLGCAPSAMAGGTIDLSDPTDLVFTGTPGTASELQISISGANVRLQENGAGALSNSGGLPTPCTISGGGSVATCPSALIQTAHLNMGDLTDTVTFGTWTPDIAATVDGQAGTDTITGSAEADTLLGGADGDELNGGPGNDALSGNGGADDLIGGTGTDTVSYLGTPTAVLVTLDGTANDGTSCPGASCENDNVGGIVNDVENVVGGTGDDTLIGNDGVNALTGGSTNANTASGNDTLDGKLGNDTLTGGSGSDTVSYATRPAPEVITASPDDGGAAGENDTYATIENITGGGGDDILTERDVDANVLDGGPGDDSINAVTEPSGLGDTPQPDTFIGGPGTDTVSYALRTGADSGTAPITRLTITLDGTANDGVPGENDNVGGTDNSVEEVVGGTANDTITGNAGDNVLSGGPGADTLDGSTGADVLNGDGGSDTATYASRMTGVTATLNAGTADDGNIDDGPEGARDDILTTENLVGGSGADTLTGDSAVGGNTLIGNAGDDLLDGLAGPDTLTGSGDVDTVTYANRMAPVTVTIDGFSGDGEAMENDNVSISTENVLGGSAGNTLSGSGGANRLVGGVGVDTISGGSGDDVIDGGLGTDILSGGANADTLSYAQRVSPVTVTLADNVANDGEGSENDSITGFENVTGGSAGDTLTGDQFGNTLDGGAGDDTLNGGLQVVADTLIGGANTDTASYEGRSEDLTLSLDETANDGAATELDVLTTIESLTGGDGADTISGDAAVNTLLGGDGVDAITSRDSVADTVNCGPGTPDTVTGDLNDTIDVPSCETIDRGPVPALSVVDISAPEGNSGTTNAVLTVSASPTPTATATVAYTTSNGTATQPADYATTSGTLTFAAGETSKTISVPVKGDTLDEVDETVKVDFSAPTNATAPAQSATITITDDDAAPTLAIGDVTVGEAAGTATFTVTASAVSGKAIGVTATTANGTATAPGDYTTKTQTLSIPAGQTTATFAVTVLEDTLDEVDETFTVGLTAPTNATVADASGLGTITDDDDSPELTIADGTVAEGNADGLLKLKVTASAVSGRAITFKATTADGTATAPGDYTALADKVVTLPVGETSVDVEVPVVGDTAVEPDETLTVTLSDPAGATLATDKTGAGTITNDDSAAPVTPVVSVAAVTVAEGNAGETPATFTVRLSAATTNVVKVGYRTADNTATAGTDYRSTTGTLTFAAGETSKTVPVPVIGDTTVEPDETFGFILSAPENATLANPPLAVGTVRGDDQQGPRKRPKVSLTIKPARDRSKPYAFALSGRLTLPAGVTKADGCTGKVVITIKRANKKTVKAYTATLKPGCTYKVTAKLPATTKPGALKATARFAGNPALLPAKSAVRALRAG